MVVWLVRPLFLQCDYFDRLLIFSNIFIILYVVGGRRVLRIVFRPYPLGIHAKQGHLLCFGLAIDYTF